MLVGLLLTWWFFGRASTKAIEELAEGARERWPQEHWTTPHHLTGRDETRTTGPRLFNHMTQTLLDSIGKKPMGGADRYAFSVRGPNCPRGPGPELPSAFFFFFFSATESPWEIMHRGAAAVTRIQFFLRSLSNESPSTLKAEPRDPQLHVNRFSDFSK